MRKRGTKTGNPEVTKFQFKKGISQNENKSVYIRYSWGSWDSKKLRKEESPESQQ